MNNHLNIVERILRSREEFFEEIRNGKEIREKTVSMLIASIIFLALYGIVLGLSKNWLQAGVTAIKLPLLFLLTLAICAPSLHYFNILFGARQSFTQMLALIMTAISTTGVLLASLAPITLFFLITSESYYFYKLLNVLFFAVAGYLGVTFLNQGMELVTQEQAGNGKGRRKLVFLMWALTYGLVGSQLAWILAPFIGDPSLPFVLFREADGNFFVDVLNSLGKFLFGR